jgi:hypothetical protein
VSCRAILQSVAPPPSRRAACPSTVLLHCHPATWRRPHGLVAPPALPPLGLPTIEVGRRSEGLRSHNRRGVVLWIEVCYDHKSRCASLFVSQTQYNGLSESSVL